MTLTGEEVSRVVAESEDVRLFALRSRMGLQVVLKCLPDKTIRGKLSSTTGNADAVWQVSTYDGDFWVFRLSEVREVQAQDITLHWSEIKGGAEDAAGQ